MSFMRWVNRWLSRRGKALSLYRAGMAKAGKQDYVGAIADYSAAIEFEDTPPDVKAMAIYNRALANSAIQENAKAVDDLEAVLRMPEAPERIRTAAMQRQERVRRRAEHGNEGG